MRKDQPKIKKELKQLKLAVRHLQELICVRDLVIKQLGNKNKDLEQTILIDRIEHKRFFNRKPPLTIQYEYWYR